MLTSTLFSRVPNSIIHNEISSDWQCFIPAKWLPSGRIRRRGHLNVMRNTSSFLVPRCGSCPAMLTSQHYAASAVAHETLSFSRGCRNYPNWATSLSLGLWYTLPLLDIRSESTLGDATPQQAWRGLHHAYHCGAKIAAFVYSAIMSTIRAWPPNWNYEKIPTIDGIVRHVLRCERVSQLSLELALCVERLRRSCIHETLIWTCRAKCLRMSGTITTIVKTHRRH